MDRGVLWPEQVCQNDAYHGPSCNPGLGRVVAPFRKTGRSKSPVSGRAAIGCHRVQSVDVAMWPLAKMIGGRIPSGQRRNRIMPFDRRPALGAMSFDEQHAAGSDERPCHCSSSALPILLCHVENGENRLSSSTIATRLSSPRR